MVQHSFPPEALDREMKLLGYFRQAPLINRGM